MSKTQQNHRIHPFTLVLAGAIGVIVLAVAGAYVALSAGMLPANADTDPPAIERWAARTSLGATIDREAPSLVDPLQADEATLSAGEKLYAANCVACHGASDGKPSDIARGLYQHAPQLGGRGVEEDPEGETYWKIAHGIRFTGMPAFDRTLTQTQLWQLATFLKHMDSLPPNVAAAWKKIPSQLDPAAPPLPKFGPPGRGGPGGPPR